MENIKKYVMLILKLTAIINAMSLGWNVECLESNKIILKKKIKDLTYMDYDIHKLVKILIDI